jgi:hypothetical protein
MSNAGALPSKKKGGNVNDQNGKSRIGIPAGTLPAGYIWLLGSFISTIHDIEDHSWSSFSRLIGFNMGKISRSGFIHAIERTPAIHRESCHFYTCDPGITLGWEGRTSRLVLVGFHAESDLVV